MDETTTSTIAVYADESSHLKGQGSTMVIGAIWCEAGYSQEVSGKIALLKRNHDISPHREIKWTKVSHSKIDYYKDLIKLFFEDERLNFRAVVIPTKDLDHDGFHQSPDEFYYKMQYTMLINLIRRNKANFKIYLDYKDSWSNVRSKELVKYLQKRRDAGEQSFFAQPIRSYESPLIQLADLLIGAVGAKYNSTVVSDAKKALIETIEQLASQDLTAQSPMGVNKFNIFKWRPKEALK